MRKARQDHIAVVIQRDRESTVLIVRRPVVAVLPQRITCARILDRREIQKTIAADAAFESTGSSRDKYVAIGVHGDGLWPVSVISRAVVAVDPQQVACA